MITGMSIGPIRRCETPPTSTAPSTAPRLRNGQRVLRKRRSRNAVNGVRGRGEFSWVITPTTLGTGGAAGTGSNPRFFGSAGLTPITSCMAEFQRVLSRF
ncbi:hypothetical protein GCM10009603_26010 [Nocardiopsis exhalans]